ncbi:MAG TPA: GGDEF domain-containing protein, partial [Dissulfurispiraceae bacterium]
QQDLLKHLEEDFYRSFVKVKHILEQQKALVSIGRDGLIRHALEKMVLNRISSVPVVQDGKAVGIITEKDVLNLASRNIDLEEPVSAHMSAPVISVGRETTLIDVVKIMNEKNIRRVVIDNGSGAPSGVITIRDVLKNLEGDYAHFLERKLKHTKDVLNLFPESLFELTDTGEEQLIIWANDRAISRFGKKVLDKPAVDLIPAERWSDIYHSLLSHGRIEDVKFKSSRGVYELSGFYVVTEGQLEKGRIQLILRDITEEVKLATTDALTSMYNRRFLNDFMAKELYRSKRMNRQFTVAILDLDDFKQINDTHGHFSGDMVLQHIASLLTKNLRLSDVIGRYGGEEFLLLMPETSKESAKVVVERLREKIAGEPITLPDAVRLRVTASFGASTFPEDGLSSEDLLITADERLYRAKKGGKNLAVFL